MLYRLLIFLGLWLVSWASAQTFDPSNPKAFLDMLGGNPCYLGFILFGIVASGRSTAGPGSCWLSALACRSRC